MLAKGELKQGDEPPSKEAIRDRDCERAREQARRHIETLSTMFTHALTTAGNPIYL